jgi:hypothetical protein
MLVINKEINFCGCESSPLITKASVVRVIYHQEGGWQFSKKFRAFHIEVPSCKNRKRRVFSFIGL